MNGWVYTWCWGEDLQMESWVWYLHGLYTTRYLPTYQQTCNRTYE